MTHRCLFDFPQHKNGMPQLHILNYLNTYTTAYKATPGQVGAVGTFYSVGTQSSIPLAFNDAIWAKYRARRLPGPQGRRRQAVHPQRVQPADAEGSAPADAGRRIADDPGDRRRRCRRSASRTCRRWAPSSCCAPTRSGCGAWSSRRGARARLPEIDKELRANLLPGVTIVPAMVIAIERRRKRASSTTASSLAHPPTRLMSAGSRMNLPARPWTTRSIARPRRADVVSTDESRPDNHFHCSSIRMRSRASPRTISSPERRRTPRVPGGTGTVRPPRTMPVPCALRSSCSR